MGSGSPTCLLQGSRETLVGRWLFLAKSGLEILCFLQNFADIEFESKKVIETSCMSLGKKHPIFF